jgi:hypothetical protein
MRDPGYDFLRKLESRDGQEFGMQLQVGILKVTLPFAQGSLEPVLLQIK